MCKPKMSFFLKCHNMKKIIIPNGHNMCDNLQIGLKICPTLVDNEHEQGCDM